MKLKEEIQEVQAKRGEAAYCVAHYDENDRNTKIEKFHAGKLIAKYEYVYSSAGALTDVYVTASDGIKKHVRGPGRAKRSKEK